MHHSEKFLIDLDDIESEESEGSGNEDSVESHSLSDKDGSQRGSQTNCNQ